MSTKFQNFLFPFNGQYFDFEGFVIQIDRLLVAVRVYETNTSRLITRQEKHQLIGHLTQRLQKDIE